jgi:glycosyltransferase involved in cell wall biosynthesis
MRILIATPLFPPELGEPAEYVWELAKRLAETHAVTVLTYAHEVVPIPNVRIVPIEKHHTILRRLFAYTRALMREVPTTDVIYAQKAGAAGFPAALVSTLRKIPLIVHFPHNEVWERYAAQYPHTSLSEFSFVEKGVRHLFLRYAQRFTLRHATRIIVHSTQHADTWSTYYTVPRDTFCVIPQPLSTPLTVPLPHTPTPHRIIVHMPTYTTTLSHLLHDVYTTLTTHIPTAELVLLYRNTPTDALYSHNGIHYRVAPSRAERQHLITGSGALILLDETLTHVPLLLEYIRMGTPILAPTTSDAVRVCPPTGIRTFDTAHPSDLTQLLTSTLSDDTARTRYQKESVAYITNTWDSHLRQLTALIRKII